MLNRIQTYLKIDNERGSILLMSYLITIVILTLGSAFVLISSGESRIAEQQRKIAQAFYVAEAGIEKVLYNLRLDFMTDPDWSNGVTIEGTNYSPDTNNFYAINFSTNTLDLGTYNVQIKNVSGESDHMLIQSTGTYGGVTQEIEVYAKMVNISPWNNAIFGGSGGVGGMVNGNVNIYGSVHILGENLTSADNAIDLGGTSDLVGNNYSNLDNSLKAKVPALPQVNFNGEMVETLNSELRVKHGRIALSGNATVGQQDVTGNAHKETVTNVYINDPFGGTAGTANVYSDNGWSNAYDLGDAIEFPSTTDSYGGYATFEEYVQNNALIINSSVSLQPGTAYTGSSDAKGSISMDANGNLTISGLVYIANGGDLQLVNGGGSNDTITYSGQGSIYVTGDVSIDTSLVTSGNASFPTNVIGVMTPNDISLGTTSQTDIMGMFYAGGVVTANKQTDILGTIVTNQFDFSNQVPSIYQVPEAANNLPPGMIGGSGAWLMKVVSWREI